MLKLSCFGILFMYFEEVFSGSLLLVKIPGIHSEQVLRDSQFLQGNQCHFEHTHLKEAVLIFWHLLSFRTVVLRLCKWQWLVQNLCFPYVTMFIEILHKGWREIRLQFCFEDLVCANIRVSPMFTVAWYHPHQKVSL